MIEFIFYAFLAACLELAFQEYMQKEMIFYFYKKILLKINKYIAKPLGLCIFCNGFWVAFFIYILHFKTINLDIILFCALNYFFLKILSLIFEHLSIFND